MKSSMAAAVAVGCFLSLSGAVSAWADGGGSGFGFGNGGELTARDSRSGSGGGSGRGNGSGGSGGGSGGGSAGSGASAGLGIGGGGGYRGPTRQDLINQAVTAQQGAGKACDASGAAAVAVCLAAQGIADKQRAAIGQETLAGFDGAAGGGGVTAAAPPPDPAVVAAQVIARLQLPSGAPKVGPPPEVNRWNMVAVGYPLWLWTEGDTDLQTAAAAQGLSVSLHAKATSTTFDMGEGGSVMCDPDAAPEWVRGESEPGVPSPSCGYTYETASMTKATGWKGTYTVTATTSWTIDWTAGGEAGTVVVERAATAQVPVGELQAVQTR